MRYRLGMPRPETHLFDVEIALQPPGATFDLQLPAWAPGSYLVRDFARHVQDFSVSRGRGRSPVPWKRRDKMTWRVEAGDAEEVVVRYRVYANDLSVQTSHLDATHAFANGPSVFMYAAGAKHVPASLEVDAPRGWVVDTALPPLRGKRNAFLAEDYDHLADSPLEIGTHRRFSFRVDGVRHRVALYGRGNEDARAFVKDLERIVREEAAMMGSLPYDEYLFIVHLKDKAGGGLEHRASNVSTVDRFSFAPRKKYEEDVLALEAHELYHAWNVKHVRPAALGPFDYTKEVHTTLLWAMEGLTSYYDHLVLVRAGILSEDRYRDYLGELVTKLREQPGRLKLSLEDSSFLTWIKLYKIDENWPNTGISYYLKGELVGLLLDLAIRSRTNGKRSLDDVMRALYARYPPDSPGIPEEPTNGWKEALEDVTGLSWTAWWKRHVAGTRDLDFRPALRAIGWDLEAVRPGDDKEAAKKGEYAREGAWLGAELVDDHGRLKAKSVITGSPAEEAGLNAGSEILAVDGFRVADADALKKRLKERAPGDVIALATFDRNELKTLAVTLARPPPEKWKIVERKGATAAEKRRRAAWLAPYARRTRG